MRKNAGFTYVIVLFAVAVAAVLATRAMEGGAATQRVERESELLYVGGLYRDAIRSYHDGSPGVLPQYPESLDDLLEDKRTSTLRRHLRKKLRDPMTGAEQWGEVRSDGRIVGVYSMSAKQPQKQGGFNGADTDFANAKSYQDWKFVHAPH
jgi:type II secretory pathway pseudopilin PulG